TFGLARWFVVFVRSTIGFDGVLSLHDFIGKTHDIMGELRIDPRDPEHSAGGCLVRAWRCFLVLLGRCLHVGGGADLAPRGPSVTAGGDLSALLLCVC